jgi:hypothetical protein
MTTKTQTQLLSEFAHFSYPLIRSRLVTGIYILCRKIVFYIPSPLYMYICKKKHFPVQYAKIKDEHIHKSKASSPISALPLTCTFRFFFDRPNELHKESKTIMISTFLLNLPGKSHSFNICHRLW